MDVLLKHAGRTSVGGEITEDSSSPSDTNLWPLGIKLRLMVVNPIIIIIKICLATIRKCAFEEIVNPQTAAVSCWGCHRIKERLAGLLYTAGGLTVPCCRSLSLWGWILSAQPGCNTTGLLLGALQVCAQTDLTNRILQHVHKGDRPTPVPDWCAQ